MHRTPTKFYSLFSVHYSLFLFDHSVNFSYTLFEFCPRSSVDRAFGCGPKGHRFDSCRGYHFCILHFLQIFYRIKKNFLSSFFVSPQKQDFLKGLSRIASDSLSAILAWFLAYLIRPFTDLIPGIHFEFTLEHLPPFEHFQIFTILSSMGFVFIMGLLGLYSSTPKAKYISSGIVQSIAIGIFLWILIITAVYSLAFHQLFFSRIMLLHAGIFAFLLSILFRGFLFYLWEKVFICHRNALVLGNTSEIEMIQNRLKKSSFQLILQKDDSVSDVFFFEASHNAEELRAIRQWCAEKGKTLFLIPAYAEEFWGHASFEMIRGIPMICATPTPPKYWWFFWKRILDIVFSSFFLVVMIPVFIGVGICIKLESKGPVFYVSTRIGKNGTPFQMIKFRSMFQDADQRKNELKTLSHREGPFFKVKNDPRITKTGKFLRKTSIDEFPNFINVLLGDMSVIGPRPHLPNEVEQYTPDQKRVLSVRPGISGLAQVSGRSDLTFEQEMLLDTYYCENLGFWLDTKIFFKTPFILAFGKGAD